jgi:hypothetical protein
MSHKITGTNSVLLVRWITEPGHLLSRTFIYCHEVKMWDGRTLDSNDRVKVREMYADRYLGQIDRLI